MVFNFNNPYLYPWNSTNAFLPNAFTTNGGPRHPSLFSGPGTPSVTAPPGFNPNVQPPLAHPSGTPGSPVFNNSVYPSQQYCESMLQFGIGGHFADQNQGIPYSGACNWNYGFQGPLDQFHIQQQLNTTPDKVSKQESSHNINSSGTKNHDNPERSETVENNLTPVSNGKDKISEEIAMKVSSMLSDPNILQDAISCYQSKNVNVSGSIDLQRDGSGNDSSDSDSLEQPSIMNISTGIQPKTNGLETVSGLNRGNSGSSVESFPAPVKVVEKDTYTGEVIVRMSPQDFDRLANQGCFTSSETSSSETQKRKRRKRTEEEKKRQCQSQHNYYSRNRDHPVFMEKNHEKTWKSRQQAMDRSMVSDGSTTLNTSCSESAFSDESSTKLSPESEKLDQIDNLLDVKPTQKIDTKVEIKMEMKDETKSMCTQSKIREQNRIRQLAFKAQSAMPKDYQTFCQIAQHLVRNAHRYYDVNTEVPEMLPKFEIKKEYVEASPSSLCEEPNSIHKKLREIRTLKCQNRIREQQEEVEKLRQQCGTYRNLQAKSGIPLKTIHDWCSIPKDRVHKSTLKAELRKEEFVNFLMQDNVTFAHPSKKYAGKRFLNNTWKEIYKQYLQETEYYKNGTISETTMHNYKPKSILLSGKTPVNQCLCDYCENCHLLIKALIAAGMKAVPSNKYQAVEETMCTNLKYGQFGTSYVFCVHNSKLSRMRCEQAENQTEGHKFRFAEVQQKNKVALMGYCRWKKCSPEM